MIKSYNYINTCDCSRVARVKKLLEGHVHPSDIMDFRLYSEKFSQDEVNSAISQINNSRRISA